MTIVNSTTGPSWGDHGYGALPYEFVLNQLAVDFWSLTKADWTDTGQFQA